MAEESKEEWVPLPRDAISEYGELVAKEIEKRIKGQPRAIRTVVRLYEKIEAGFRDSENAERPLGSYMFMGPSGVGKTSMVRALAKHLFGSEKRYTYIDCGRFEQGHEVSTLTGAPPGYIGFNQEPDLSQSNIDYPHLEYLVETGAYFKTAIEEREELIKFLEAERQKKSGEFMKYTAQIEALTRQIVQSKEKQTKEPKEERLNFIKTLERNLRVAKESKEACEKDIIEIRERVARVKNAIGTLREIEKLPVSRRVPRFKALFKENAQDYNSDPEETAQSIILFDEIEEASPDLYKLLLGILDQGTLRMNNGSTTRFRNSIIVMTTNLGSDKINNILSRYQPEKYGTHEMGFGSQGGKELLTGKDVERVDKEMYACCAEALREYFEPKFVGRINQVVVFRPLSRETMLEIVDKIVKQWNEGAALGQTCNIAIMLRIEKEVKEKLVDESLEHWSLGARPLEEKFNKIIDTQLAPLMNMGLIEQGDEVLIRLIDGHYELFKKKRDKVETVETKEEPQSP